MKYQENKVITGVVVLAWDGLRNPEQRPSGSTDYNVSVIMPNTASEIAELTELATKCLNESEFNGVMPAGGNWPLGKVVDAGKFGPTYNAHTSIKAGTPRGIPTIVDTSGNVLDAMTFGPMLYPGCLMQLIVHAFAYNNVQKGVAFGLDAIKIVDATAPALPVASGMSPGDVVGAFGNVTPSLAAGAIPTPTMAPTVTPPGQGPGAPGPGAPLVPPTSGPMMTPAAEYSYEQYISAGWTDETLRSNGLMQ